MITKNIEDLIENMEINEKEDGSTVLSFTFKEEQTEEESEMIKAFIINKIANKPME